MKPRPGLEGDILETREVGPPRHPYDRPSVAGLWARHVQIPHLNTRTIDPAIG